MSEIGQSIGALGTVISALALLGVVRSLQLQRRQTQASEEEVVRVMRNDLMLVALKNREYLPLWGLPPSPSGREMALRAYLGMEFSYFETALRHGRMTELELEKTCANIFHIEIVREFWQDARVVYLESGDESAAILARIAERHYRNAAELAAIEASPAAPVRLRTSPYLDFDTLDVAGLLPARRRQRVFSTCLQLMRIAIWLMSSAGLRRGPLRRPLSGGSR
ncbi:DUF6082 family protein [Catenuloplanes sp. NPDC051500]|uniref:DUF6082 family protein n=1 Tax=Catenuloplanes sp. NPDC051500 TaxID=3363959 RepID=UPI0037B4B820